MTELELYKWVQEYEPEWRWDLNGETKQDDVIMWIYIGALERFVKMLPSTLFDEGGIEIRLTGNYVAIWINEICDHLDIEIENIFPKEKS